MIVKCGRCKSTCDLGPLAPEVRIAAAGASWTCSTCLAKNFANGSWASDPVASVGIKLERTEGDHPAASTGAQREKLNAQPYDLVPFQEMTDAYARVAEFGAMKYAAWNWSKGLSRVQLIGSLLRHTFAYLRGQDRDADSGLLHTDHILWNAVALVHNVHWELEDGRRHEPPRDYQKRD